MDDTTAKLADIVVPSDDGEISQRLADLESKLDAWTSAVAEVHRALKECAVSPSPADIASPPESPTLEESAPLDMQATPEPKVREETNKPQEPRAVIDSSDPQQKPVEPEEEFVDGGPQVESAEPELPSVAEPTTTSKDILGRGLSELSPISEESPESHETDEPQASASHEEDEALLNSLDPEMAKTIRVMRRVSPVKRTVKELIEEYEARQSSEQAPTSKKKSWWARG